MGMYVTLTLPVSTYNEIIERLQDSASSLKDYFEMEELVQLVETLEDEYRQDMDKQSKEYRLWKKHQDLMWEVDSGKIDVETIQNFAKIKSIIEEYDEKFADVKYSQEEFHFIMEILEVFQ